MDVLWVPSKSVSHQFSNAETDFVMHVEYSNVLVFGWMLLVVDSCKAVECSSDLEDVAHFVLEECFTSAVVVEAEVGDIIHVGVNITGVVEHEVKIEEKTLQLHPLIELESSDDLL